MTVHPRAQDFAQLQAVCDQVIANETIELGTSSQSEAAAELHHQEAWYEHDRGELLESLQNIGIEPMCVLRRRHWSAIVDRYGLFTLNSNMVCGQIGVLIPDDWKKTIEAVSKAQDYVGATENYLTVTDEAIAEARRLPHKELLLKLMPDRQSLPRDFDPDLDHLMLKVSLPPMPEREANILLELHKANAPHSVVAVPEAIQFSPSIGTQLGDFQDGVEEEVLTWENDEPLITVPHESAVALVGQRGDYLFETKAVQAAVSMS